MPRYQYQTCDICERVISNRYPSKDKMGMVVTLGYSHHGWGKREDAVSFSGEVCTSCFNQVLPPITKLFRQKVLDAKKNKIARYSWWQRLRMKVVGIWLPKR